MLHKLFRGKAHRITRDPRLTELEDNLSVVVQARELAEYFLRKMREYFGINSSVFFYVPPHSDDFINIASVGHVLQDFRLNTQSEILKFFQNPGLKNRHLIHLGDIQDHLKVVLEAERMNIEVMMPVFIDKSLCALILLGNPQKMGRFKKEHLKFLSKAMKLVDRSIVRIQSVEIMFASYRMQLHQESVKTLAELKKKIGTAMLEPLNIARGRCETYLLNVEEGRYSGIQVGKILSKSVKVMRDILHETEKISLKSKDIIAYDDPRIGN